MGMTFVLPESKRLFLYLILAISCLFSLIILSGYLAITTQQQATESQIIAEINTIAEMKAKAIADWFQERESDAYVVMQSQIFAEYLKSVENSGTYGVPGDDLTAWMKVLVTRYHYFGIILLNQTGSPFISVPDHSSVSHLRKEIFLNETLHSANPVFTDIFSDPTSGIPLMEFWVPVRIRSGEPAIGALVMQIDPEEYLYPLIQTWPSPATTAESLIVRRAGDEVQFINRLRHFPDAALNLSIPLTEEQVPAVMAVKGYHGIVKGNDYRGVPVIASVTNIPGTPWFIVAKIDQDEIYAPFREFSRFVTGVIILLLCVASLGILVFWKVRENAYVSHQLMQTEHELYLVERIRAFMQQANDAIFILDTDWHILEANDRATEMYGYSLEEFRQKTLFDLRSEEAKRSIEEDLKRFSQLKSLILVTEHQRKDGSTFPVEDSIRITDFSGTPYIQAIVRDITERVAHESELQEKNAELCSMNEELSASYEELASQQEELRDQMEMIRQNERELAEINHRLNEAQKAGHVGIWEYYIRTGTVWGTDEAYRIFGLTPGQNGLSDISDILRCIPDRDRVSSAMRDLIENNMPFDITYLLCPADGSADRYISSIGELRYDEDGNPFKVVGVIQDITEKHRMQEDLSEYQEKLSALFHAPIIGSVLSDMDGSILQANDEFLRIIGYSRDELSHGSVRWTDITPPEFFPRDFEALRQAQETGSCTSYEKQYIRKDGSRIWVLIGYVLVGPKREEAVSFVLDISRAKENEERIRSLNQELEERVIERTNQLQFVNEELQMEIEERISAEKNLQSTLSVLSATIESTADGILVVDANRRVSVYNKIFAEMWQIPDAVLRLQDEMALLKSQASLVVDPEGFCSRIAEIYQNPEADSFDVIVLSDNRVFERISKPQRIGYTIAGRVFSFRDVSRQKEMELQIEKSLREKEILLKEIHHRVKNNMQVVSSLLFMQARLSDDPRLRDILLESQNRVKSIALVHEELYQSMDLDRIDYTRYLRKIARNIFDTYKVDTGRISLRLSEETVYLTISKAVPCSLIVNELISNSLKHAFPDNRAGTISIEFRLEEDRYILIYADDGIGIAPAVSLTSPKTLGLELIQGLVRQLTGTIHIDRNGGTRYEIQFPA